MANPLLNRRSFIKLGAFAALGVRGAAAAAGSTSSPIANSLSNLRERSISFYNLHTTEKLKTVYWAEGQYIASSLTGIDHLMRDHRNGEIHEIDRRLLDLLCGLNIQLETSEPFQLVSGYRSPASNSMLRSHSGGVAKNSLHLKGMAADIRVPGRSVALVREAAVSMQVGGVGYYPDSQFVHVDVGRIRTW